MNTELKNQIKLLISRARAEALLARESLDEGSESSQILRCLRRLEASEHWIVRAIQEARKGCSEPIHQGDDLKARLDALRKAAG